MQEKILADLEKSYDESRRTSGEFPSLTHRQNPNTSLPFAHPAFRASRAENVLCVPRRWGLVLNEAKPGASSAPVAPPSVRPYGQAERVEESKWRTQTASENRQIFPPAPTGGMVTPLVRHLSQRTVVDAL